MPIVKEIQAKSIINKTNLPEGDFVINPYTGCEHGCLYCYARFMKRFTGHEEEWGEFVDVKVNAPDLIPKKIDKYKGKQLTFGSVCDPYQPLEKKYQLMRKILKKIIPFDFKVDILTKSALAARDIDLFKHFAGLIVAFSFSSLDENIRRQIEPLGSPPAEKIKALKQIHKSGIKTAVFISPIWPKITDWRAIIEATEGFADEYWFENLNIYPSVRERVFLFLRQNFPELVEEYRKIGEKSYWEPIAREINDYCRGKKLDYRIYFHHQNIRKK